MRYSERTQVLLTPAQREKLHRVAERSGRSVGAIIRDAIDAYEVETPVARRQDALERLLAIQWPGEDWRVTKARIAESAVAGLPDVDDLAGGDAP